MRASLRRAAVLAVPVCLLVAVTAAQVVEREDVRVEFTGVTFALESAAGATADWQPAAADWHPSTAPWDLVLADDTLPPGGTLDVRVAVRNASGTPADVVLDLVDPDPETGDLFAALQVTVAEDGTVLAAGPADTIRVPLAGEVGADRADERVLDLSITLPLNTMPDWRTGVQVAFEGTSR